MLSDNQPIKKSSLQVKTDVQALPEVMHWFEQFKIPALAANIWQDCYLVLVEGFTNAVLHAHKNLPPSTTIELEAAIFPFYIEIKIWDWGQPFNLEAELQARLQSDPDACLQQNLDACQQLKPETINLAIEQAPVGGRGLLWMHKLTDELSYLRVNNKRNCLLMRKKIRQ